MRHAELFAGFFHKETGQPFDVFTSFTQWRHVDWQYIQPIVQVLAEAAFADRLQELAVRRRDHPDIHVHVAGASDPQYALFLQHAEDLYLNVQRHLANFIEKNCSAMRQFKFSWPATLARAGECAVLIAEQLALHQVARQCAAIDRDKRSVRPVACLVDRLRDHFFAGAAFALDQHRCQAVGGDFCQAFDFYHAGTFAHDVLERKHGCRTDHSVDQFTNLLDFTENVHYAFQPPLCIVQRDRRLDEMQDAAPGFDKKLFVRIALAGFQHFEHDRLEVDQFLDMFSDRFLRLHIKNLGAGRIDKRHGALSVDHQQSVRDRVNDRRMQPGGVFQLLLRPAHLDHVVDCRCRRDDHP